MFDRRVLVPIVAIVIAVAVVVAVSSLLAPRLQQRDISLGGGGTEVEHVMVAQPGLAPAPKLRVSAPQASSSVVATGPSSERAKAVRSRSRRSREARR